MKTLAESLRELRESRGVSKEELSERTHIGLNIIEDLERGSFERITAPIYGSGFIKIIATKLGADPAPLRDLFMEEYGASSKKVGVREKAASPAPKEHRSARDARGPGEEKRPAAAAKPPRAKIVEESPKREVADLFGGVKKPAPATIAPERGSEATEKPSAPPRIVNELREKPKFDFVAIVAKAQKIAFSLPKKHIAQGAVALGIVLCIWFFASFAVKGGKDAAKEAAPKENAPAVEETVWRIEPGSSLSQRLLPPPDCYAK